MVVSSRVVEMVSKSTASLDLIYCQSVVGPTLALYKQRRVVLVVQPFAVFCGSKAPSFICCTSEEKWAQVKQGGEGF